MRRKPDYRNKYKKPGVKFFCAICGERIPNEKTKERIYHGGRCLNQAKHLRNHMERLQRKLDLNRPLDKFDLILKERIEKIFKREIKKDETLDNF
jgi:hypothetical protein